MARIIFPIATNIKSLQKWGDNDISKRIKQSFILYDKTIIETGTYNFQGAEDFVLQGFEPWEKNPKEVIMKKLEQVEKDQTDRYIRVFNGKTKHEKYKYRVEKKDMFIADYRTVDVISEVESGSYGKKVDFLEYADIYRDEKYWENIKQNTIKDLHDKEFAEAVAKTHGRMPTVVFLNNLNDSLAMSQAFSMPVAVDSIYSSLLEFKTKKRIGSQFSILERLTQIGIPDFSELSLERILELRKDKALTSFRNLISTLSSRLQSENNLNVEALFTQDLLRQIKELAPSKKSVALATFLGTLSNVPLPFIGAVTTIADIGKELNEYRDFSSNWLSFILRASE